MGGAATNQEHELVLDVLQIPDAAFAVNASQHIVAWNTGAEQLLGYRADEALGAHCYDILRPGHESECHECRFHCVTLTSRRSRVAPRIETSVQTSDGSRKWLALTPLVAHTIQGQTRIIHLMRDVTEYHHFPTAHRLEHAEYAEQRDIPHADRAKRFMPPADIPSFTTPALTTPPAVSSDHGDHSAEIRNMAHDLRGGRGGVEKEPSGSVPMRAALTRREHEVLRLLACGMATDEIAQQLSISRITARNHVNKVIEKLGVSSRLQAVVVAAQRNLI